MRRYGSSTQLVFSGIGNVHAVNDAFEELRNALDPTKMESRLDRWKGDAERWKGDASGSVIERAVRKGSLTPHSITFENGRTIFKYVGAAYLTNLGVIWYL